MKKLLDFFLMFKLFTRLGVMRSEGVVTAYRRPLGYVTISAANLASAYSLKTAIGSITFPVGTVPGYAVIQQNVAGVSVRWRDDGTAPTSTVGMVIGPSGELDYAGDIYAIQFILVSGSPILDCAIYE